ncbi:unnamed protein product [Tilletia laevis]|uniref:Uncharacterized protein n=2 Tax=Tilletia TaxID=13289 RepID=A0A9N8LSQ9_9BASI|nr:hypothetical protein CF336_g5278 [Tilletia laevis]KAE8257935.1 hypothetical protein A4X03_0g4524 [Tilletia caries]CAD6922584.1 unnamed protein product [Tilletia controversa]KAE8197847.1 hypothetical protein CF335_g4521 [Tilletia laevis]CAD6893488.1 unnamed protein product [Tilletia caries]
MEQLVILLRRAVQNVGTPSQGLPDFCLPKGAGPLFPVFLAGLMDGTAKQQGQSALGLSKVVHRTSADAIKPFLTTIVGASASAEDVPEGDGQPINDSVRA